MGDLFSFLTIYLRKARQDHEIKEGRAEYDEAGLYREIDENGEYKQELRDDGSGYIPSIPQRKRSRGFLGSWGGHWSDETYNKFPKWEESNFCEMRRRPLKKAGKRKGGWKF